MVLNKKWFIGGGAAAVLLAGGIYGGTALAQTGSSSASATTTASASASASAKPLGTASTKPTASARAAQAQAGQQAFLAHLASRLGVSTDTVTNAMKGAAKDMVADEVKSGKLTQAQADQIDQKIDIGKFPLGVGHFAPPPGATGPRGAGFAPGQVLQAAATALNMQPKDLGSQLAQGKSLKDVAAAQNVPYATVATTITSAVKPGLDQAVSSGKLSATQEQNILAQIQSGTFNFPKGGPGPHGARPNGSARPKPAPSASSTP